MPQPLAFQQTFIRSLFKALAHPHQGIGFSHFQAAATSLAHPFRLESVDATERPTMMNEEAPLPPAPNECCESGCDPCVWDIYYAALRQWQELQQQKNTGRRP